MNYYNEYDPKAAAWIRELIRDGIVPDGFVDERSIADVRADDLRGYVECHFFAGIGGWSRALSLAGSAPRKGRWTASLPCQPFSEAGKGKGFADERHLWPVFFRLVRECRPRDIIGEQVSSKAALGWLDGVFADLEAEGYACGAFNLCSAGVGSPNIRRRLYWVANAQNPERRAEHEIIGETHRRNGPRGSGTAGGLADSDGERLTRAGVGPLIDGDRENPDARRGFSGGPSAACGPTGGLGDSNLAGPQGLMLGGDGSGERASRTPGVGFWDAFDVIPCADGKQRRIEPGTFPLVARLPGSVVRSGDPSLPIINPQASAEGRIMRLRGYGNAINAELAAEFVRACDAVTSALDLEKANAT